MRKSLREQHATATAKAKTQADLAEARRQREYYADQEARLAVLATGAFDEDMGDHKEEVSTRRALKKANLDDGRESPNNTTRQYYADQEAESFDETMEDRNEEGPSRRASKKASLDGGKVPSNDASVYHYSSPARQNHTSNKRNQVSSPPAHYAPKPTGDDLATYLEPGGAAEREVRASVRHAQRVLRSSSRTRVEQEAPHLLGHQERGNTDEKDGYAISRVDHGHATMTGLSDDSSQESGIGGDGDSYGHEAFGTSPLLSEQSPDATSGSSTASQQVKFHSAVTESTDSRAGPPPRTGRSSLRASSFAPVIVPTTPTHATAVDIDPDFFEGAALPGSGPGPHFITASFIKNGKEKIRDQLLSTLATTLTLLTQNIPGVLLHCITKGTKIAPLDSTSASHFPTTGMGACNYMYVQNKWSLQPGTRNKPKLPAAKVGKDGRPLFDENRGYDGPDRITAVLWITCDGNAKDAIEGLQMELEGEHLQIRWKPAQKKNTKNQIVIYGIPPVFDAEGIMAELLHGLKESEKELCAPGSTLDLDERNCRRDLALPLLNGYFKQAIPPKAVSLAEGKETSLNNNKEYTQNGCRVFNLEYDPSDNVRMAPVWTQFKDSGRSELVLGRRSKVFVVPHAGRLPPAKVTEIRRYMHFHLRYTARTRTHSHPTLIGLDKLTEVTMEDPSARPPRKFTSMRNEYMDLRTPDNLEVFHAVFPRRASLERESSVDCLFLEANHAAREISLKIQVCPSAWWWHVFRSVRGYSASTARSLLRNFEIEAEQLADQSTFDAKTMTVTTQFANTDDFLMRAEAELGSEDDASIDGTPHPSASIEISDGAKASLAAALLKKDNNLATNSHASAKSRRSTYSCSTGNDTNRSMNTAKYAINHKSRALELASERKKSADLEATQRAMAQRIRELEASFANTPPTPLTAGTSTRSSVRISEPPRKSMSTQMENGIQEVMNMDDSSEEEEWTDDVRAIGNNAAGPQTSPTASHSPSRTGSTATGAGDARSLGGLG